MRLRILADDLTGALECACAFARRGPVGVHLQGPTASTDAVQVVCSDTRLAVQPLMAARLAACLPWFTGRDLAFKKVDSLLRGNTFAELAWLARQARFDAVVLAPAFPAQGRLTVHGQQCVLPPASASQSGAAVRAASQQTVDVVAALQALGLQAFHADHQDQPQPRPGQVMVLNATDDSALQYLATLHSHPAASRWLWCGTGALASQLAAMLGNSVQLATPTLGMPASQLLQGPILVVTASRHPVLRGQWALLQQSHNPADRAHAQWMLADLMDSPNLSAAAAQQTLADHTAKMVRRHPRPAALVVVGGDTLLALCKASGATALRALPPVRPGWGHAQLQGGVWDGIACFSRSGAFGDPYDLLDLLQHIQTRPH